MNNIIDNKKFKNKKIRIMTVEEVIKRAKAHGIGDLVLKDGRIYNEFSGRKMTKAQAVNMINSFVNSANTRKNNEKIRNYIENVLGIERFNFSSSSSYYRINGNVVRVSSHWATSEKYDEPTINTYSSKLNGHVEMIEKIKNLL